MFNTIYMRKEFVNKKCRSIFSSWIIFNGEGGFNRKDGFNGKGGFKGKDGFNGKYGFKGKDGFNGKDEFGEHWIDYKY